MAYTRGPGGAVRPEDGGQQKRLGDAGQHPVPRHLGTGGGAWLEQGIGLDELPWEVECGS